MNLALVTTLVGIVFILVVCVLGWVKRRAVKREAKIAAIDPASLPPKHHNCRCSVVSDVKNLGPTTSELNDALVNYIPCEGFKGLRIEGMKTFIWYRGKEEEISERRARVVESLAGYLWEDVDNVVEALKPLGWPFVDREWDKFKEGLPRELLSHIISLQHSIDRLEQRSRCFDFTKGIAGDGDE